MASSKAKDIRNALIAIIAPLQLDGEVAFTEVKGHPRGEFDGYPSVRVLPGEQSTQKAAFSENDRTIQYIVRTHLPATNDGTEFDKMYELTDLLLDTLDTYDYQNQGLGGLDAYFLNATRGDWFEEDSQGGTILSCDINVEVTYSKTNQ